MHDGLLTSETGEHYFRQHMSNTEYFSTTVMLYPSTNRFHEGQFNFIPPNLSRYTDECIRNLQLIFTREDRFVYNMSLQITKLLNDL